MSALPPKADIAERDRHVRFVPKADILHCGRDRRYSITSSVRASNPSGTLRPSAFAVRIFDNHLVLGRRLDRQIGYACSLGCTISPISGSGAAGGHSGSPALRRPSSYLARCSGW